jgi:hypothetical protein
VANTWKGNGVDALILRNRLPDCWFLTQNLSLNGRPVSQRQSSPPEAPVPGHTKVEKCLVPRQIRTQDQ